MNINKIIAIFTLLCGVYVPAASAIPISLSVDPDIPLGSDWTVLPGGGFLNPPCSITNDLTGGPRLVSVELSSGETDVFEFGFNFYGFGSAIGGGCIGDAYLNPVGSTLGSLFLTESTDLLWIAGGTEIYDFGLFELYDPDFVYVLDETSYVMPRGYSLDVPAPPIVWLITGGLIGFMGMAKYRNS
jgi:hypothetical protein